MVRPSMSMRMVIDMKVNSGKDLEKGKVFAIMYLVTFMMAIGKKMKKMVRVNTLSDQEINTKVVGLMVKRKEMMLTGIQME